MAQLTPEQAAQKALEAADKAAQAAAQAKGYAETAASQVAGAAGEMAHAVSAVSPFVFQFTSFVLAIFVGYYVVWAVTPALHTPLMSVTNAISSVIVVGALLAVGGSALAGASGVTMLFGFLALVLASVNIFGGFLVTHRMLAMYKKKG